MCPYQIIYMSIYHIHMSILDYSCVHLSRPSKKNSILYLIKWRDLPYEKATWEVLDEKSHLRGAAEAVKQYDKLRSVL